MSQFIRLRFPFLLRGLVKIRFFSSIWSARFNKILLKTFEEVSRILFATNAKILFHQHAFGFALNRKRIAGFVGGRFPTELAGPAGDLTLITNHLTGIHPSTWCHL